MSTRVEHCEYFDDFLSLQKNNDNRNLGADSPIYFNFGCYNQRKYRHLGSKSHAYVTYDMYFSRDFKLQLLQI